MGLKESNSSSPKAERIGEPSYVRKKRFRID